MKNLDLILNKTDLNWEVTKKPFFGPEGERTPFYGIFRNDNDACLGSVTQKYTESQNAETLNLILEYFGNNINVDDISGGHILGGKQIWFTIKQQDLFAGTPAHLEQHLIIKDSHDGSSPVTYGFHDKVLLCSNGLTGWSSKRNRMVRITHTSSLRDKLLQFEELYAKFLEFNEAKKAMYTRWMSAEITRNQALKIIGEIHNTDTSLSKKEFVKQYSSRKLNKINAIMDSVDLELSRQGNTLFGLLQGVTHYTSHVLGKNLNDDDRLIKGIHGGGQELTKKTLQYLQTI